MLSIKEYLNPAQFEAVTTIDGAVLVIAGAGSGKTRVIEYRVLHLIQQGVDPRHILLLTFTRKAAREMLERASRHDPRCGRVEGGTFHSFGLNLLRRFGARIGLDHRFTVLDEADSEEAIQRCATKAAIFSSRIPKKSTLRNIISMAVNRSQPIEAILRKEYPHFLDLANSIRQLSEIYHTFKQENGYVDYDDLLIHTRALLENERIREVISDRYRFIMVDEYQDTNLLQRDITYLLADRHQNVMVVGDDAQSIYGFRGASFANIFDFPQRFPDCRVIKLEENYRSTQSILNLANAVLENMAHKYAKCLRSAKGKAGPRPELLEFSSHKEEAEWVADKIIELKREGIDLKDQGVLFRASFVSIPLQAELNKRQIPFQVFGGLRFSETAHVKDLLSHLKVYSNPSDELAWMRVLLLIEGVGTATADSLIGELKFCADLGEVIQCLDRWCTGSGRYHLGLSRLRALLVRMGELEDLDGLFGAVLKYYMSIFRDRYDDWHRRQYDLELLREIILNYSSLEEFFAELAIDPPERKMITDDDFVTEPPVTLSTIHSAKGLEWEVVFLIGLIDGVLPSIFTHEDQNDIEEERRLFYVAITRAKEHLFLTLSNEGYHLGRSHCNSPSRFIEESGVRHQLKH